MDDDSLKQAEITVKSGKATGISSRMNGAAIDAVAFNLEFITDKNPMLAIAVLKLYQEAAAINAGDPHYPEEDYDMAFDEINKLIQDHRDSH